MAMAHANYENRPKKYEHLTYEEWYNMFRRDFRDGWTSENRAFMRLHEKIANPDLHPEESKFELMRLSGLL